MNITLPFANGIGHINLEFCDIVSIEEQRNGNRPTVTCIEYKTEDGGTMKCYVSVPIETVRLNWENSLLYFPREPGKETSIKYGEGVSLFPNIKIGYI